MLFFDFHLRMKMFCGFMFLYSRAVCEIKYMHVKTNLFSAFWKQNFVNATRSESFDLDLLNCNFDLKRSCDSALMIGCRPIANYVDIDETQPISVLL